jgi:pimeloyl-ACP methyl ester carboxylesterase
VLDAYTRRAYSPEAIDRAIVEAGERLHLVLADVDARNVLAHSKTCTLLVHGAADSWLPADATRAMAALAPSLHYTVVPAENHLTLPVRVDWLAQPLADWLQARSKGRCDPLTLPADPAVREPALSQPSP